MYKHETENGKVKKGEDEGQGKHYLIRTNTSGQIKSHECRSILDAVQRSRPANPGRDVLKHFQEHYSNQKVTTDAFKNALTTHKELKTHTKVTSHLIEGKLRSNY